jgi:formylglycine-generating enzyme required for sulfatase activity
VDATLTEIFRQFSFATETEQARLAPTQTAYVTETQIAQATASQHALETAVEQAFRDATATQQAIEREVSERLATQITWTPTPTSIPTATPTPTATLTALEQAKQAIERARTFTGTRNGDWQPFSYVFSDGVERVLVPVGCFRMGSNNGDDDEQPVHEQCVTEPFWLDKYEVTNALYGSVSGVQIGHLKQTNRAIV